jgi:cytochrome c-type biogenesis protein CcmH/NrfG
MVRKGTSSLDIYALLGDIYETLGRKDDAADVYRQALRIGDLPDGVRRQLMTRIASLTSQ